MESSGVECPKKQASYPQLSFSNPPTGKDGNGMPRLIVGMMMWFGMGIVVAEVLRNFGFDPFHLTPAALAAAFSLLFLFSDRLLHHLKNGSRGSGDPEGAYRKTVDLFEYLKFILTVLILLFIPFLWWGVIRKLAVIANEGKKAF